MTGTTAPEAPRAAGGSRAQQRTVRACPAAGDDVLARSFGVSARTVRRTIKSLTPAWALPKLHIDTRRSIANDENTCPEALAALGADSNARVRAAAAENPRCPPSLRRLLATDKSYEVRCAAREDHPLAPADATNAAADDRNERLDISNIYHSPKSFYDAPHPADAGTLRSMARGDKTARAAASRDPATPPAVLRRLILRSHSKPGKGGRATGWATEHPACPVDAVALTAVMHDKLGRSPRAHAAANPNCPAQLLAQMSRATPKDDDYMTVRTTAAANPSTPPEDLRRLSRSGHDDTRAAAASNRSLPPKLLPRLTRDPNPNVVAAALRNPNCPPKALTAALTTAIGDWPHVAVAAARHDACPPETLAALAERVNRAVASDDYDAPDYDDDPRVTTHHLAEAVAQHPATPQPALAQMAQRVAQTLAHADDYHLSVIAEHLIAHPGTPTPQTRRLRQILQQHAQRDRDMWDSLASR